MPPTTRSRTARKAAAPYEESVRKPKQASLRPAPLRQVLVRSRDDDDAPINVIRQKKARPESTDEPATTVAQEAPVDTVTPHKGVNPVKVGLYLKGILLDHVLGDDVTRQSTQGELSSA
ncbi:hypothetical protein JCM1841_004595 [Sporobolomyces salmonicolor]